MPEQSANDGELRRRAAWLLGMLFLVAILIVVLMTTVLNSSGGSGDNNGTNVGPDPITSTGPAGPSSSSSSHRTQSSAPGSSSATSTATTSTGADPTGGAKTCPTSSPCVLPADVGSAVAAVNAYRAAHGKAAVPGSVSAAAQACALARGNGCSGGWAETELSTPDGAMAVSKISQFAKLLDPMKAIQVGWAYNPSSKTYYFSTIRTA